MVLGRNGRQFTALYAAKKFHAKMQSLASFLL